MQPPCGDCLHALSDLLKIPLGKKTGFFLIKNELQRKNAGKIVPAFRACQKLTQLFWSMPGLLQRYCRRE
jgi:hypothetical protein